MTPHDEWDDDGVNESILADIEINGAMRKGLVHFDRNGFAYTLDRVTGELLVAEKYGCSPRMRAIAASSSPGRRPERWARAPTRGRRPLAHR